MPGELIPAQRYEQQAPPSGTRNGQTDSKGQRSLLIETVLLVKMMVALIAHAPGGACLNLLLLGEAAHHP